MSDLGQASPGNAMTALSHGELGPACKRFAQKCQIDWFRTVRVRSQLPEFSKNLPFARETIVLRSAAVRRAKRVVAIQDGTILSGGQRQRFAIPQALLKNSSQGR
jgi:hypothetical protein